MKNYIFLFFAFAFGLISCDETKPPTGKKSELTLVSGVYEGKINNEFEIILSAETKDGMITGSYFYRKIGTDISISGISMNDHFQFSENDANRKITGIFSGTVFNNGDSLAGEWKNADASKTYSFSLKRSADPAIAKIRIKWHYFICIQKADPEYPEQQPYMEGYSFPEINGMENAEVQKKLNAEFYPKEIDESRKNSDYESVKEISEKEYEKINWPNGHSTTSVSIDYYSSRVITSSRISEFDGGAHPSFGFYGYKSVFLANGKTVTVNDLLQGEWKEKFLEAIRDAPEINDWSEETDDPCNHVRDTLLERVSKWNGTEPVFPTARGLLIIADDYRNFYCPEMAREVFEISIEWEKLKPFLRPGNPLEIIQK